MTNTANAIAFQTPDLNLSEQVYGRSLATGDKFYRVVVIADRHHCYEFGSVRAWNKKEAVAYVRDFLLRIKGVERVVLSSAERVEVAL